MELEHRTSKVVYPRINKHDPERDIGRLHRRQEVLQYLDKNRSPGPAAEGKRVDAGERFKISEDVSNYITLTAFTSTSRNGGLDPAKGVGNTFECIIQMYTQIVFKDFLKKLKNYILRWTSQLDESVTSYDHFTDEDRAHVKVVSDTLYRHKTLQLRYTTYDMREEQDKLNQAQYQDIMVLSDDEDHPYLYGRVLDFFHAKVTNCAPNTILHNRVMCTLPMVWIHWFKLDSSQELRGFTSLRYPSVSFCSSDEPDAFGFIHPDEIVRAVHLIPGFKSGHTTAYLKGPSKGRPEKENEDWKHFKVNM